MEVSAKAQLLDTETSSAGATLEGDFFYSLPNYQHHPQMVLLFTPGISFGSNQYTATMSGMSVDGIGSGDVGYFEDGAIGTMGGRAQQQITNTETVANSIEDIKVFTSAMPAEYGHSAGVGVSVVKKSGTNAFHGLLSETVRTRRMQDRRYFEEYRNSQLQPGWTTAPGLIVQNPDANVSGPVYIPHLYNGKNKTFFFLGWQMMLEKQGKQLTGTVPTPDMLNGDFSFAGTGVSPNLIYDPTSTRLTNGLWYRDPFPGNIVPRSEWSKVATAVLGTNPVRPPNMAGSWSGAGPSGNIMLGPEKITKWQNYTGRLDQSFGTDLKAYGTYTYNHNWGRTPAYVISSDLFDSSRNLTTVNQNTVSGGLTWIPAPTVLNDFRASYYAQAYLVDSISYNKDYATLLGLGGLGLPKTCMPDVIPSFITDPGGASMTPGCGSKYVQENYTVKDDVSKSMGKHQFKMGYELLRYHLNSSDPGTPDGTFTYLSTSGLNTAGGSLANTGQTLAQFMVGAISGFSFTERLHSDLTRSWQHSFYIQDDWKVAPNLTVNLGLRWNVEPPKHEKYGFISLFDLTKPDNQVISNTAYQAFCPVGGCVGAYTHPQNASPYNTQYDRWDPVAGLSWHFSPKMVFKAGARMSHLDTRSNSTSILYTNELMTNTDSVSTASGDHRPLFILGNAIPSWSYPAVRADGSVPYTATNPGNSVSIVSRDLKSPYVATWSIGVQRELTKDYLLEVRYDGSAEVHGYGTYNINSRPWGIIPSPNHDGTMMNLNDPANAAYRATWVQGGVSTYQTQFARPYPNMGDINIVGNVYHMDHHAGIVRIEKRFSKGINFQAFYQFSKSIGGGAGNPYLDWHLFKARTASDQTHNLTGLLNYEIPVGKGRHFFGHMNRALDMIFGGYNFMWTYTIASGLPAGASISNVAINYLTYNNISPSTLQYPGFMPTYGSLLMKKDPSLRSDWQDLGGDRWTQANENSMINCGSPVLNGAGVTNQGNDCFTYAQPFSLGNNGSNYWNNQRIISASAAVSKEVPLKGERFRLAIRLDSQNPFHWYNWGGPSTALNVQSAAAARTFGTIDPGNNGETSTGTSGFGGTPLMNLTVALKW